jgi:hypothetical protein
MYPKPKISEITSPKPGREGWELTSLYREGNAILLMTSGNVTKKDVLNLAHHSRYS